MNENLKMLLIGLLFSILGCKMYNVVFGLNFLIGWLAYDFYKTYQKEKKENG